MCFVNQYRIVIARDRSGPWRRRWQWAVEDRWPSEPRWRLKKGGHNLFRSDAIRVAFEALHLLDVERIELHLHLRYAPRPERVVEQTPLPPELLSSDEGGR